MGHTIFAPKQFGVRRSHYAGLKAYCKTGPPSPTFISKGANEDFKCLPESSKRNTISDPKCIFYRPEFMANIKFVPQTGTKDHDVDTRKSIRRHVMLGKNAGRTHKPKQPRLAGCAVFRQDDWTSVEPPQPEVPQRVGSDLSFLDFADTVELPLMHDTLRFCSATNEKLFMLEPCVDFNVVQNTASCVQLLTHDNLHVNIMVFGTQTYMDQIFWQSTSRRRQGPGNATLQHYGRALSLLRERLPLALKQRTESSDIIIITVVTLAMHALITGDIDGAKNHVIGLYRLVNASENGVYSFRPKTKQLIEILRCDISIALATGQMPVFLRHHNREPIYKLPKTTQLTGKPHSGITFTRDELGETWEVLRWFSTMINGAFLDQKKISDKIMLETMASTMYMLLAAPATANLTDEVLRLAILSFCSSTLLQWRQVRVPFYRLQLEFKRSLTDLMKVYRGRLDKGVVLWCLMIYGIAFAPISPSDHSEVQLWMIEVIDLCELNTWDDVKTIVKDYLWIDNVCDPPAQKLAEEALAERLAATDIFDVLG